ncbi:hypothetical protein Daesc_009753 [Daldinia eschscholtzii]|uniref:Uncharacterized protein n=1 Tax=Daldinia eschscholtzii TaxID=292717 RepID=A0AAX6MAJ4_9PEZI
MSDPSAKTPAATASGAATTGATAGQATSSKPASPGADAPSPESQTSQTSQTGNPHILPASHWAQLPPVNVRDDDDSAFEDAASSTASLTASILEYRTVNGRTYHSERGNAQSWGPNDAIHDESMDIFDFADQYPNAEVIGVDVSPQQPQWIPPNLRFEVDDVTQPWTYEPDSFDYIHIRWLVGTIPDWYALFREAYQALKPGGYLESQESSCMMTSDDGTVKEGSPLDQWSKVFSEAGKKTGRTFTVIEEDLQRKAMEAAGFEITYQTDIKVCVPKPTKHRNCVVLQD